MFWYSSTGGQPDMPLVDENARIYGQLLSRRRFLRLSALAAVASFSPRLSLAALKNFQSPEKSVSFYNTHTEECLARIYWAQGKYLPEALSDINYILRDHRSGEIRPIDFQLLDLVHGIGLKLDARKPFHIISGYRSPKTNALLRKRGRGVARNSLHMVGKAVDIRLPGCPLSLLRRVAMEMRGGGVGYYPRPDFVHIDVGRVRYW